MNSEENNANEDVIYSDPDLYFQCAQDPLEGFTQNYPPPPLPPTKSLNLKRLSPNSKIQKRHKRKPKKHIKKVASCLSTGRIPPSFVINGEPQRGIRLIKIKILDLLNYQDHSSDSECDDSLLFRAQYVVKDTGDDIMDQTEKIISNISKKLCGYSYNVF